MMDPKSMRRIREENIKRLEESQPPLEAKLKRADVEHKFCPAANKITGVCDVPEKQAQQLVSKFAQEHRMSALVSGNYKETNQWPKGADQKAKKKKAESIDEAAMKAREKILSDLNEETRQLEEKCRMLEELDLITDQILREFKLADLGNQEKKAEPPRPCVDESGKDEETYKEAVDVVVNAEEKQNEENEIIEINSRTTSDTSEDTD